MWKSFLQINPFISLIFTPNIFSKHLHHQNSFYSIWESSGIWVPFLFVNTNYIPFDHLVLHGLFTVAIVKLEQFFDSFLWVDSVFITQFFENIAEKKNDSTWFNQVVFIFVVTEEKVDCLNYFVLEHSCILIIVTDRSRVKNVK